MSNRYFAGAFAAGLLVLAWVATGFIRNQPLALAVTLAITAGYLVGSRELRRFRDETHGLTRAVAGVPPGLGDLAGWLQQVPASLRESVRLRIETGRGPLPGPSLTPYLVGLLVMLGMLGTFLGMVASFRGTVIALEGSTDLQAMRSALAAPIQGLGLAFGTSVAGVAASAMLGLLSTIARRERAQAAAALDACIAGPLRPFTPLHQRQETARAVQAQAGALPAVAERLQALIERIEGRSRDLDAQLLERHAQLQERLVLSNAELARRVGEALQDSLASGARAAGQAIEPVVAATMSTLSGTFARRSAELFDGLQSRQAEAAEAMGRADAQRLAAWTEALQAMSAQLAAGWERTAQESTARQRALLDALAARESAEVRALAAREAAETQAAASREAAEARALASREAAEAQALVSRQSAEAQALALREAAEAKALAQHATRLEGLAAAWGRELAALREQEATRAAEASARLENLQAAASRQLAELGATLEAPMSRLMQMAAEVPQAAAGVISRLREEMASLSGREDLALQERNTLLARMHEVLQAVQDTSDRQRTAVDALVGNAADVMSAAAQRFAITVESQGARAAEAATHSGATAVELASMAEAFRQGVQLFQETGVGLVAGLERIEGALERSTARSDEQLAYYVAQAREVIDLSIASQQGLLESLSALQPRKGRAQAVPDEAQA